MPICGVIWKEGRSDETKLKLREALNNRLSKAVDTRPDQINVYFHDLPDVNMPKDGALVRVYISEGRTDEAKDAICEAVGTTMKATTQ